METVVASSKCKYVIMILSKESCYLALQKLDNVHRSTSAWNTEWRVQKHYEGSNVDTDIN